MEFIISQKLLQKAMSVIGGCIEKKSSVPMLQNVKIESVGENNIRITATDLDTTMRIDVEAEIKTPGVICINGEKLSAIVPTLPDGDVSFTKDANNWASITAGKSTKMRIAGTDENDFPEIAANKSTPITLKNSDLRTMLERTVFSTSQQLSQFALNAVKLEIGDGFARMASTDQARLALANLATGKTESLGLLIPRKAAIEIMKIEAETVNIGEDANHLFVEGDGFMLTARKLTGRFPNYEMIIPKDNKLSFGCDVLEMKQAIRRCGMFASLETVRCELGKDKATLTAQNAETGEIQESIEIDYSGEPVLIGFRWPHLLDFLNLAGDGKLTVAFNENPSVPALLTAETLPDYQYILVLINLAVTDARIANPVPVKPKAKKK